MRKFTMKIRKPKIKGILCLVLALSGMLVLLSSQPAMIFAAAVSNSTVSTSTVSNSTEVNYATDHILVKFSPEVEDQIKQGKKTKIVNKLERKCFKAKTWNVKTEKGETPEILMEKFNKKYADMIEYAQLDYICKHQVTDTVDSVQPVTDPVKCTQGTDPLKNTQNLWYLNDININDAWAKTRGNPSVVIAILDTGAAYQNAALGVDELARVSILSTGYKKAPGLGNLKLWVNSFEKPDNKLDDDGDGYTDDINGFNFIDYDGYPHDDNGHGTAITNLIAYNLVTEQNVIGIAPQCTFMILKVLDHRGRGYSSTVAEGIYYAVDHGARVINLSLAWPNGIEPGPVVRGAVAYAANAGVIMVAGTGNNALNLISYPAAYGDVISVGASQFDHKRAWYSNYGSKLEIMAPGGNNYLDTNLDGQPDGILQETFSLQYQLLLSEKEILANPSILGYSFLQGTSFATALVTGVVGLMISLNPKLDLAGIRKIIHYTATDIGPVGWDLEDGYGLLNAGMAIYRVLNGWEEKSFEATPSPTPTPNSSHTDAKPDPHPESNPKTSDSAMSSGMATYDLTTTLPTSTITSDQQLCPDCLVDLEIETECDDECLNDEEIEGECPN